MKSLQAPTLSDVLVEIRKYSGCGCCRKPGDGYFDVLRAHINARCADAYTSGWNTALECGKGDLTKILKLMCGARDLEEGHRRAIAYIISSCIEALTLRVMGLSIGKVLGKKQGENK